MSSLVDSPLLSSLVFPFLDILDWGRLSSRLGRDRAVRKLLLVPIDAESTAKVDRDFARGAGTYGFGHLG